MKFLRNATLNALDPLNIMRRLNLEDRLIYDTVSAYANQELRKRIKLDYKNNNFDKNIIKEMGNLGLLGMTHANIFCKTSYLSYGLSCHALESIDSAYRSMLSVQSSLVIYPICKYGTREIKNQYLDKLVSGEMIGCFGLTESNAGSNPNAMKTTAYDDGDSYIITGNKLWITHAPHADVFIIWAKLINRESHLESPQISGFVLDKHMNGINVRIIENKLSMQASSTGEITLTEVKIPKTHKLEVSGMRGPLSCLNQARFGVAWGALGAASDSIIQTLEYAENRQIFNKSLLEFQAPQIKLANCISRIASGYALSYYAAIDRDEGIESQPITSILKRENCYTAIKTALICRDLLGANGITDDYSPLRHALNLQSVATYEGTSDIHALIIGKELTGISAFK